MTSAIAEAKALADEMLAAKTTPLTFIDYVSPTWRQFQALNRLRESSLADVLVPEGENLGFLDLSPDGEAYYGKVDDTAADDRLAMASARAWGWDWPEYAERPNARTWSRKIELRFAYGSGGWDIGVSFSGNSREMVQRADVIRNKWHLNYVETGYEGHDQKAREATATEIRLLTDLVAEIARSATKAG